MLVTTQVANVPSARRLAKLWVERYTPDLSALSLTDDAAIHQGLIKFSSLEGRALTATKLKGSLIQLNCQLAAVQARTLYEYIPNVINLREARRLTQSAFQIYIKLLELYQEPSLINAAPTESFWAAVRGSSLSAWDTSKLEDLTKALEPTLVKFQKEHVASLDWRALGFVTTQLNFSNKLLLQQLTPIEQALIRPYFKFLEEQVAVPWQRVCAAAAYHDLDSPAFRLVEQMIPVSTEIAITVYHRLVRQFSHYQSRRGGLEAPGVAHSCLRDLNMFQAYLWLCLLEESLFPIEKELVSLCVMVVESLQVRWELVEQWNQLLIDEIISRVTPDQKALLLPYIQGMQAAFYKKRARLGVAV